LFVVLWLLKQEVPKVVKSINRELREKSIKTKVNSLIIPQSVFVGSWFSFYLHHFQVGAFSVLKELVVVLPDCRLADHFGSLVPGIEKALNVGFFFSKEISCLDSFCLLTYQLSSN
jgi:cullin-associated NEDD8-dissociated protein 1